MIDTGRILQHKNKGFIIPVNYLPRISLSSYFINEERNLQGWRGHCCSVSPSQSTVNQGYIFRYG